VDTNIIKRVSTFRTYILRDECIDELCKLTTNQRSKLNFEIKKVIKGAERIHAKIEELK